MSVSHTHSRSFIAPFASTTGKIQWVGIVALAAIVSAAILYVQNMNLKKNPQAASQKETTELVAKVSKLVVLPEGETPTIATVSDPEALKDQPFFAQAEKGDKVLIYTNSKKAVVLT